MPIATSTATLLAGLGAAGGSVAGGMFAGRKSKEEKAALQSATSAQGQLAQLAREREDVTRPGLEQALNYYRTLLGGDRQAMMNMLAAPIQATSSQYEQGRRNLLDTLGPGGARDLALGRLEQGKVGDIGRMFTGVQPMAAEALSSIYTGNAPSTMGALQALLYGSTGLANTFAGNRAQGMETGLGIGNLIAQILFGKKDGGGIFGSGGPAKFGTGGIVGVPGDLLKGIQRQPWDLGK